ncbi:MAG: hotdog fold domain-containing protein, partial [Mycetocola sp.]
TIRLDARLNGPSRSANGGFASGMIAETVGGTASVRLVRPIPLERPLEVEVDADGLSADVTDSNRHLVATVKRVDPFTMIPPVRPRFADAEAARAASPLHGARHLLSTCVVCGPDRQDGLAVTPGPLASRSDVLAAPFVPSERDATGGVVHAMAVWGALDCPSYPAASWLDHRLGLLGTLTAHLDRDVFLGERLVAVGWTVERHGRSTRTASALLDERGDVVASARAVWVELKHQWLIRLLGRFS